MSEKVLIFWFLVLSFEHSFRSSSLPFSVTWRLLSGLTGSPLLLPCCVNYLSLVVVSSCPALPSASCVSLFRVHSWRLLVLLALECLCTVDVCIGRIAVCFSFFVVFYCSTLTSFGGLALIISDTFFLSPSISPSTSLFQMIALSRSLPFCHFIFAFSFSLPPSTRESAVIGYCFWVGLYFGPFWFLLG